MEHISREKAYEILKKYMVGENYLSHSLAVEANREYMMHIERCGIPYAEFAEIALDAMKDFEY